MLAEAETDGNALRTVNSIHDHQIFGTARGRCPNTAYADRATIVITVRNVSGTPTPILITGPVALELCEMLLPLRAQRY